MVGDNLGELEEIPYNVYAQLEVGGGEPSWGLGILPVRPLGPFRM